MVKFDKYVKIVLLSTLAEPKTLVDMSMTWFQNKGRLYQPVIIKEIKKAVKDGWLLVEKKRFYRANMKKLLKRIADDISLGENHKLMKKYSEWLHYFYITLGIYTQPVYLDFEVVDVLTKREQNKAVELDLKLLLQLPFILRYMESEHKLLTNLFIQVLNLEEYVKKIEKREIQQFPTLKEQKRVDDWVVGFDRIAKLLPKMQKKGLTVFKKNINAMKALGS